MDSKFSTLKVSRTCSYDESLKGLSVVRGENMAAKRSGGA